MARIGGALNLELNQEMETKEADPAHLEYRVLPGIIDLDHLELVALKRVSKSSWMPHLRLIAPSDSPRLPLPATSFHTRERVGPPQRGPKVSCSNTMEWPGAYERSSVRGPAYPGVVIAEVYERSPTPGPEQLEEEVTAEVVQPPKTHLGIWGRFFVRMRKAATKLRRGN